VRAIQFALSVLAALGHLSQRESQGFSAFVALNSEPPSVEAFETAKALRLSQPKGATVYGGAVERSETEGEWLKELISFYSLNKIADLSQTITFLLFPFRPLISFAATFPASGDSFWSG
jgi:hypothetical protein